MYVLFTQTFPIYFSLHLNDIFATISSKLIECYCVYLFIIDFLFCFLFGYQIVFLWGRTFLKIFSLGFCKCFYPHFALGMPIFPLFNHHIDFTTCKKTFLYHFGICSTMICDFSPITTFVFFSQLLYDDKESDSHHGHHDSTR